MELYLSFLEPHRIRYVTNDNTIAHDDHVEARYEFTTTEGSHRLQGDLRGQDLIDHFDFDVIWSDKESRTDSFGSVRGIGAIQRMKMWRDRYTTYHYLTFYANRTDRRYREYLVYSFDAEIKNRDDSHRRLRLTVRGRRGSATDSGSSNHGGSSGGGGSSSGRRFSVTSLRQRPRTSSSHHHSSGHGSSSHASSSRSSHMSSDQASTVSPPSSTSSYSPGSGLDIRFIEQWTIAQNADAEFRGVPFPSDRFELPSPEIFPGSNVASSSVLGLSIVEEPPEGYDPRSVPS
ncbi:hypothetical protein SPBR_03065 [Sporothrix brasiliensis 5110]|uniref:Uncharacterized protein n=1 Tax=Sporothrix brasiliensis 5110 TaxID=1398154 RepID=A0A0C2J147_9PEZI|nr:uncharacterized protein SPBR_03065 [Sporothrix brasiliensis 5110]KIH92730.1 hypothetical protein SPBR_03065 [Sporothrix brasiliensis 5110]